MIAALAHHVPGKWVGHTVLSNTFRHPAVLAKAATLLDQATGGRFILGLGAGWHEDEHAAYGIPLPPIGERMRGSSPRSGSSARSTRRPPRRTPGVTLEDPFYPLRGAVNLPAAADARRAADLARRPEAARPEDGRGARRRLADSGAARSRDRRYLDRAADDDPARDGGDRPRPDRLRVRGPDRHRARTRRAAPRPASWHSRSLRAGATHVILGLRGQPRTRRAASRGPRGRRAAPRRRSGDRGRGRRRAVPGHGGPSTRGHDGAVTDAPRRHRPEPGPRRDPRPAARHRAGARRAPSRPRLGVHPGRRRPRPGPDPPGGIALRPAARDHGRRDRGERPARDIRRARARRAGAVRGTPR